MIHIQIHNTDTVCFLSELVQMHFFDQSNVISIEIVQSDALNLPVDLQLSEFKRDHVVEFKARIDLLLAMPGMVRIIPDEVFADVYKTDKKTVIARFDEGIEMIREFAQDLEIQLAISKP